MRAGKSAGSGERREALQAAAAAGNLTFPSAIRRMREALGAIPVEEARRHKELAEPISRRWYRRPAA